MRYLVTFAFGMLAGLAIWRAPYYAGAMMDRVAPETPQDWAPKVRTWHNGVEQ